MKKTVFIVRAPLRDCWIRQPCAPPSVRERKDREVRRRRLGLSTRYDLRMRKGLLPYNL
jgi:hypothetical protein